YKAGQSVEQRVVGRDRPGEIEIALDSSIGTGLHLDFPEGQEGRSLRDQIDDSAGAARAVDRRGWPPQDRDPFEAVRLEPEKTVRAVDLAQAVAEHAGIGHIDAADRKRIVARIESVAAGTHS